MIIRSFEKDDWKKITEPIETGAVDIDDNQLDMLTSRGIAITVEDEMGVVGCGGTFFYDDCNAELWIRLAKRVELKTMSIVDSICAGIKILTSMPDVKFYCRVRDGFRKGEKLAKWLGFKKIENHTVVDGVRYDTYILL